MLAYAPGIEVNAHHGNIFDAKFGLRFFEGFDLIFGALDNLSARRHVNRLALAAGRPLVEAGTTGMVGQTQPIAKGESACYDCTEKKAQKVFPMCTIRSTPEKPVHCIVWAKQLYTLLFGDAAASMLHDSDTAGSPYMAAVEARPAKGASRESYIAYARGVFEGVFKREVEYNLKLGDKYAMAKFTPKPLDLDQLQLQAEDDGDDPLSLSAAEGGPGLAGGSGAGAGDSLNANVDKPDRTAAQNARAFLNVLALMLSDPTFYDGLGTHEFDKDRPRDMAFVTTAAMLRAEVFGIEQLSDFKIKSIAGNIVPAVATTNAIAAGLQVLTAISIIRDGGKVGSCREAFLLSHQNDRGTLIESMAPNRPNPNCYVCNKTTLSVFVDVKQTTLGQLVQHALKDSLGLHEPNVSAGDNILHEEGDDCLDAELDDRVLAELPGGGVQDGTTLDVYDYSQGDLRVEILVRHRANEAFDEATFPNFVEVAGGLAAKAAEGAAAERGGAGGPAAGAADGGSGAKAAAEDEGDDSDIEILEDSDEQDSGDKGAAAEPVDVVDLVSSGDEADSGEAPAAAADRAVKRRAEAQGGEGKRTRAG